MQHRHFCPRTKDSAGRARFIAGLMLLFVYAAPAHAQEPMKIRLPFRFTARGGAVKVEQQYSRTCQGTNFGGGFEVRTKGKWFGAVGYDNHAYFGDDILCGSQERASADTLVFIQDGIHLSPSKRFMIGIGRKVQIHKQLVFEAMAVAGKYRITEAGESQLPAWFGVSFGTGLLWDHVILQWERAWVRATVQQEAHPWPQPHTLDNKPRETVQPFTAQTVRPWAFLRGFRLGVRF
jgi:hypothetical protein